MSANRTDSTRRTPRSGGRWSILLVAATVAVLAVVAALLLGTGPDDGSDGGTSTQPSASGTGQSEPAQPSPSGRGATYDLLRDVVDGAPLSEPYLADDKLVVASGPDGWEVLRLGLDGTRERALGPVPADKDPTRQLLTLARR